MTSEWREAFCPMCRRNMGMKNILTVPNKPWTKVGQENLWEKVVGWEGETHFGVIKSSEGRGTMRFVGYYEIDGDVEGYFPFIKNRILSVLQDWLNAGWIAPEEIPRASGGTAPIIIPPPVPRRYPAGTDTGAAGTPPSLRSKWAGKAKNIGLMKKDIDKLRDVLDELDGAAEAYEEITREGYSDAEEYQEEKNQAWDEILEALPSWGISK